MPSKQQFIERFSAELKSCREYGHISGMIDALHNLAVMEAYCLNMTTSLAHLGEAEQLLRDLDEETLAQIGIELRTDNSGIISNFIITRTIKLAKLREKLQQRK